MFRTRSARHRKSRFGVRAALATSAAVLAGVLLAVAGTAGSYALWNTTAPITDATITSGSLAITVKYGSGAAGSSVSLPAATGLLPGDYVNQEVTVANTGSIPATLSVKLGATVPYEIRVAAGACPAGVLSGAALTTTAVSYGTMPANVSSVACVQVLLPASAAASVQGTASPFTITITAAQ
ncbi:MAG TPA: hypothetical protein VNR36_10730 [Pseudolysinimonas sp.]|nr:hypothetical protein [Pseudolysinimonas sp.]